MIIHRQTFERRPEHGIPGSRYDAHRGHRTQPIQYHPNSAIEALRKIEHRQTHEHGPEQNSTSQRHPAAHREHRSQPVRVHQESALEALRKIEHRHIFERRPEQRSGRRRHPSIREERRSTKIRISNKRSHRDPSAHYLQPSSKTGSSSSCDSSPCPDVRKYRDLPEAVNTNIHHHSRHPRAYSTSNKRGLEQPSASQLAKRPRLNPGAYAVKYSETDADESDIYSNSGESTDRSEYRD